VLTGAWLVTGTSASTGPFEYSMNVYAHGGGDGGRGLLGSVRVTGEAASMGMTITGTLVQHLTCVQVCMYVLHDETYLAKRRPAPKLLKQTNERDQTQKRYPGGRLPGGGY
jgi:hypothetical protein